MTDTVYTESVVNDMVTRYNEVKAKAYDVRSAVVAELAKELKTSVASVRSKLVRENVYVAKEASASNSNGMSKEDYVKAFEAVAGTSLRSFTKATKKDLEAFWNYIVVASDQKDVN